MHVNLNESAAARAHKSVPITPTKSKRPSFFNRPSPSKSQREQNVSSGAASPISSALAGTPHASAASHPGGVFAQLGEFQAQNAEAFATARSLGNELLSAQVQTEASRVAVTVSPLRDRLSGIAIQGGSAGPVAASLQASSASLSSKSVPTQSSDADVVTTIIERLSSNGYREVASADVETLATVLTQAPQKEDRKFAYDTLVTATAHGSKQAEQALNKWASSKSANFRVQVQSHLQERTAAVQAESARRGQQIANQCELVRAFQQQRTNFVDDGSVVNGALKDGSTGKSPLQKALVDAARSVDDVYELATFLSEGGYTKESNDVRNLAPYTAQKFGQLGLIVSTLTETPTDRLMTEKEKTAFRYKLGELKVKLQTDREMLEKGLKVLDQTDRELADKFRKVNDALEPRRKELEQQIERAEQYGFEPKISQFLTIKPRDGSI